MVNSNFPPNSSSFIDFTGYGYGPPPSSSACINHTDQGGKRERTKFNEYQLRQLERVFEKHQYPQGAQREQLAASLTLTETKIQVWFKNRRAKSRANKKFEELRRQTVASLTSASQSTAVAADSSQSTKEEQPGGTEDEDEGAKQNSKPNGGETVGKTLNTSTHFPSTMPMIPLPSAMDFKVEPPSEPAVGTADQHFLSSMTSTFNNPMNIQAGHPGWMSSAYPMFGNSASYGLGFANHPSSGYYHSAYDLYNPTYYGPSGFGGKDSQKFS